MTNWRKAAILFGSLFVFYLVSELAWKRMYSERMHFVCVEVVAPSESPRIRAVSIDLHAHLFRERTGTYYSKTIDISGDAESLAEDGYPNWLYVKESGDVLSMAITESWSDALFFKDTSELLYQASPFEGRLFESLSYNCERSPYS